MGLCMCDHRSINNSIELIANVQKLNNCLRIFATRCKSKFYPLLPHSPHERFYPRKYLFWRHPFYVVDKPGVFLIRQAFLLKLTEGYPTEFEDNIKRSATAYTF